MITEDHKRRYEEDGCVLIENAFSDEWVSLLTKAFDRHLDLLRAGEDLPVSGENGVAPPDGNFDDETGTSALRNAAPHDPDLARWVAASPAAEIVGQLTGADAVQFWYDLWFCKDHSAGGATPWHHDASGHPFTGAHMPSLWVGLTDVTEEDAPLLTYKGSHKDKRFFRPPYIPGKEHLETPTDYGKTEEMLATVEAHPENIQTWTCKAGDALLIHPLTWHASLPQAGEGRRRLACTTRWLGTDLVWDPKPFGYEGYYDGAATMKAGDTAPVDFLPVLWTAENGLAAAQ